MKTSRLPAPRARGVTRARPRLDRLVGVVVAGVLLGAMALATVQPALGAKPGPTAEPGATATPKPGKGNQPTPTPAPVATPRPTPTPAPAATPKPTVAPAATPAPPAGGGTSGATSAPAGAPAGRPSPGASAASGGSSATAAPGGGSSATAAPGGGAVIGGAGPVAPVADGNEPPSIWAILLPAIVGVLVITGGWLLAGRRSKGDDEPRTAVAADGSGATVPAPANSKLARGSATSSSAGGPSRALRGLAVARTPRGARPARGASLVPSVSTEEARPASPGRAPVPTGAEDPLVAAMARSRAMRPRGPEVRTVPNPVADGAGFNPSWVRRLDHEIKVLPTLPESRRTDRDHRPEIGGGRAGDDGESRRSA